MFIQRETHLLYEGLYSSNPINVFHLVVKQLNTFAYCTIAIEWLNCLHKCILNKQIFWARLTDGKQKRWARFTVKYADLSQTTSEQPQADAELAKNAGLLSTSGHRPPSECKANTVFAVWIRSRVRLCAVGIWHPIRNSLINFIAIF